MLMHYLQTREQSAVLLKLVIAELGQHDAPFCPMAYAVWYEHMAGINPPLSQALNQLRAQQPRLRLADVEALFRDHIAEPDAAATKAAYNGLQRVMSTVAKQAADTGREADVFGGQLEGLSRELHAEDATHVGPGLAPQLHAVTDGTQRMQTSVAELAHAVAVGQTEIEGLRLALDRARTEAITDPLSQLLNRKGFDDAMRKMLAQPAPAGHAHCLVMLDIDHFKVVNDTHGHLVGDTVIQTLGQLLKRIADAPGQAVARVGGEEFAILMAGATLAQATQLAQAALALVRAAKIRNRLTQEFIASVTISAGAAAYAVGDDATRLIAAADAALYRAKLAGRDRVVVA
jgi:diguanylate cyclase